MKSPRKIPQTNSLDVVAWALLAVSLCFPAIALTLEFSRQEENRFLKARGIVYRSTLLHQIQRDYPPAYPSLRPQILKTDPQDWALLERSICQELEERSADSPQQVASELTTHVPPAFRSISVGMVKAASCL